MKLCFSLMRDISANAVCNPGKLKGGSDECTKQHKVSVTFSMQRIPLEHHFEFIPAHSVIKSHGHRADFDEILSAVERGALQGLISGSLFGLRVRGLRVKFVELQLDEDDNLLMSLFECARDSVLNGIYSGIHVIAEQVHDITIQSKHSAYKIFKLLNSIKLNYTEIQLSENIVNVRSSENSCFLTEIDKILRTNNLDFEVSYKKAWVLPLEKRLSEILSTITRNIAKDDVVDFENWIEKLVYRKEIAIIENKSLKLPESNNWISEADFITINRSINQSFNVGLQ